MGIVIDFDLSTVLLATIVWLGLVSVLRWRRHRSIVYLLFFTLFFIYLIKVFGYTQFPIYLLDDKSSLRNVWTSVNFIPLLELQYRDLNTSVLNIFLMIPFGFGLPFISRSHFGKVVLMGIGFSIMLEWLQLVTGLVAGGTRRVVDINDVIFNTVGVIVGYFLFTVFRRILSWLISKWGRPQNSILDYIAAVVEIKEPPLNIPE